MKVSRLFTGHKSIGRVTIYGNNAMHWGVNIWTKRWGYVCFRLPFRSQGCWWPLYFYCSPNATPWASTFYIGFDRAGKERRRFAKRRKAALGHNFDTDKHRAELSVINKDSQW